MLKLRYLIQHQFGVLSQNFGEICQLFYLENGVLVILCHAILDRKTTNLIGTLEGKVLNKSAIQKMKARNV